MFVSNIAQATAQGRLKDKGSVREYALVVAELDGTAGSIDLLEIEPHAEFDVSVAGTESAHTVVEGSGELHSIEPPRALQPGSLIQSRGTDPVLVKAGNAGMRILRVSGLPSSSLPQAELRVIETVEQEDNPFHAPEQGFLHMSARWLVDKDHGGSSTFTLGQSTFAAEMGCHKLHRHPHAQELFYILEGEGVHLLEDGEVSMKAGDIVLVPTNEWHGFSNTGSTALRAIFGYLGVNSLDDGGYELPE